MNNIEKGKQYMHQMSLEILVSILFRDFSKNVEEFNEHLDLLLENKDVLPQGTYFYRARTIGPQTYNDLFICSDENNTPTLFGFIPKNMLAPPAEKSTAGRASRVGESFLYLANKPEVCCAEVRPVYSEMISVMKFKLKNDICVLDLMPPVFEDAKTLKSEMLKRVIYAFVEPVKEQNDENYLITQHIANYYRLKGYEGIKYGTLNSKDPESYNLVIFD